MRGSARTVAFSGDEGELVVVVSVWPVWREFCGAYLQENKDKRGYAKWLRYTVMEQNGWCKPVSLFNFNGILVPVRTSFSLRRRGGKTYNVST